MDVRVQEAIHLIDKTSDSIHDGVTFRSLIRLREALLKNSDTKDDEFIDRKWMGRCRAWCEELGQKGSLTPTTATEALRLIAEPALRTDGIVPADPDVIRKMCISQKNRIFFTVSLKQVCEDILNILPSDKRMEEQERMEEERKEMMLRLEALIRMYRFSRMRLGTQLARERLENLESIMKGSMTSEELIYEETIIGAERELLEEKMNCEQIKFDDERILSQNEGLDYCKVNKTKEEKAIDYKIEKQPKEPGVAETD